MRKKSDVKFIIYQSLYIFVVCVVAIKGANLDLKPVIDTEGKSISYISEDSLRKLYDRIKQSVIVDTNYFVIVDKKRLEEDARLREIVANMPHIDLNNYVLKSEVPPPPPKVETPEEKEKKVPEIQVGSLELFQYHNNQINNKGDVPITIKGVTIPAHSTGSVLLGGEDVVTVSAGSVSKSYPVKENRKPKISIQRIATMGEDTKVTQLQRQVCFRVTIEDDFPDQIDVKFTGPISVETKGSATYDVTLNAFHSKAQYDNFTENKDSPYSLGFTVSAADKIAPHKITAQQSFIFGDW
jgi:hypothetical protein